MTTPKSRPCRWHPITASVAVAVALCSSDASASAPPPPPVTSAPGTAIELYLQVTLNGVAMEQLSPFLMQQGRLHADAPVLRALGLKWPGSDADDALVPLARLPGLQVAYDEPRQRVVLTAPLALLDRPLLKIDTVLAHRPQVDPAAQVRGLLLNYDLYAQQSEGQASLSGVTEARVFGVGAGIFSNTVASSTASVAGDARGHHVRLDTAWQRDFPDEALTLTVGDSVTGAVAWSRALRMGGVRLASNFSLQPYRVSAPLAVFPGSAVLPSTVDLFINGVRQSSQQVQPGQFQLNSAPSLTGTGQAQMVITDINGQRRVVSFDLYGAPQLLAEGLSDWSLDVGVLRQDYALRSSSYGNEPLVSASARYGWTDRITLETHLEATDGLSLGGVGGAWLLGRKAGVLTASLAGSQHAGSAGMQAGLGYQWIARDINLSLRALRADAFYRDVASLNQAVVATVSDSAYLGLDTRAGQFGVALFRQKYPGSDMSRLASLSWSQQLPGNATLTANLNRNLGDDSGASLYVGWSMSLDRDTSVSASLRKTRASDSLTLDAARSAPPDEDGWGWRVQAGAGEGGSAQGQVSRLGAYGQWSAGVSHQASHRGASDSTAVFANASGSLVAMEGQVQAMRRVDDAFAVVSTSGIPGVPVRLENRLVGETNARGMLFVTRLNPYQHNRLSIDTLRLPPDMRISQGTLDAVPAGRSGVLARFDMRRILAVQLSLRDAAGDWLPAGSPVAVEAPAAAGASRPAATFVGYDGQVYLEDPAPGTVLRVQTASAVCRTILSLPEQSSGLVDLGPLACRQLPASAP